MTEHKFTDEEVIKALEHCGSGYPGDVHTRCSSCPLSEVDIEPVTCFDTLLHDLALDLINRQKAEIEEKTERLRNVLPIVAGLKSEAIKEYLAKVLEKKDTASHYAPGAEVVTVEVLEHYARQFTEGSGE